jgi:VanZ family protein
LHFGVKTFRYWIPALLWLAVIAVESAFLSSNVTGSWLWHLIRSLHITLSWSAFERLHHLLRKGGHVCGYGILCILMFRAWYHSLRQSAAASHSAWKSRRIRQYCAYLALAGTLITASLDEWHQSFDPTRTAALRDVGLDMLGGVSFLLVAMFVFKAFKSTRGRELGTAPA